jgi:hypothetical protein
MTLRNQEVLAHYATLPGVERPEDVRIIDVGNDSTILMVESGQRGTLVKSYHLLQDRMPSTATAQRVVERYYDELEQTEELLKRDRNPNGDTLLIGGELYSCRYCVAPKGKIGTHNGLVYVSISKWVPGESVSSSRKNGQPVQGRLSNKVVVDDNLHEQASGNFERLSEYINVRLGTNHRIVPHNVKMHIDDANGRVIFCITDLAANFVHSYGSEFDDAGRYERDMVLQA